MGRTRITIEQLLWILVFILALGIRMLNLGAEPLSDPEAIWALQALSIFPGNTYIEPVPAGSQVTYLTLTGLLFSLFGSANFFARFLPALAGGFLCLLPYLFRNRLGRRTALILGFAFALDPGLVAISRQAGSPMLALSLLLFSLVFLSAGRLILAGVLFGLAIMSGPAAIQGLIILIIAAGFVWLSIKGEIIMPLDDGENSSGSFLPPLFSWKKGVFASLATILLAGTLFSLFPVGLGAWLNAIPAYFSGWVAIPTISVGRLLGAIVFYQPIGLIFGVIAAVRGWFDRSAFAQRLAIWFITALIIVLVYPYRQVGDLIWALVPLWGLAAIELSRYIEIEPPQRLVALGQAVLILILLALFWLNLAGMSQPAPGERAYILRLGVLFGICLLAIVTTLLLGFGWSWQAASHGLVWGVTVGLGLYQIAGIWNASFTPSVQQYKLWNPVPQVGQADLLMQTIRELSSRTTGRYESIEIASAVDAPSLRWLFRSFPNARFIPVGSVALPDQSPAIVLTLATEQAPSLSSAYRGQDFIWWRYPGWDTPIPPGLPSFAVYRQFPSRGEQVILWARSDLFPQGAQPQAEQSPALPRVEIPAEEDLP